MAELSFSTTFVNDLERLEPVSIDLTLYVAATRARDELWLGWYSTPTRFLDL